MATVSLILLGGPLDHREQVSKRDAYVSGEYIRVINGKDNSEHVYRVDPNCRTAHWVHS